MELSRLGGGRLGAAMLAAAVLVSQTRGQHAPDDQRHSLGSAAPAVPAYQGDSQNITVQVGDTAFLPCSATIGGNNPVWIRRKDYHILTGGKANYITDQRFQVLHNPESSEWTLQIRFVNARDNGTYECQVSSGTGYMSQFVRLHVLQPVATIPSGPEYHVQQGTAIQLVCVVDKSPTPPSFVFWYHGDDMINYKLHGGVKVDTQSPNKTFSRLSITDATLSDSGNYSCKPSNAIPASVWVYVSQGDKIAAIQRKANGCVVGHTAADWLMAGLSTIACILALVTR